MTPEAMLAVSTPLTSATSGALVSSTLRVPVAIVGVVPLRDARVFDPASDAVTRTVIFRLKSADWTTYSEAVAPVIATPLRYHWYARAGLIEPPLLSWKVPRSARS